MAAGVACIRSSGRGAMAIPAKPRSARRRWRAISNESNQKPSKRISACPEPSSLCDSLPSRSSSTDCSPRSSFSPARSAGALKPKRKHCDQSNKEALCRGSLLRSWRHYNGHRADQASWQQRPHARCQGNLRSDLPMRTARDAKPTACNLSRLRIGMPLWDLRTGERYIYCGPSMPGMAFIKNERGLRVVGIKHLSRGPRTAERHRIKDSHANQPQ